MAYWVGVMNKGRIKRSALDTRVRTGSGTRSGSATRIIGRRRLEGIHQAAKYSTRNKLQKTIATKNTDTQKSSAENDDRWRHDSDDHEQKGRYDSGDHEHGDIRGCGNDHDEEERHEDSRTLAVADNRETREMGYLAPTTKISSSWIRHQCCHSRFE